jgi:hypothetical protein
MMQNDFQNKLQQMFAEMPEPLPAEMAAAYDPATWAFTKAMFKTLMAKGIFTVGDITRMHEEIQRTAQEFRDSGEVQREAAVNDMAEWLARYAEGLGKQD